MLENEGERNTRVLWSQLHTCTPRHKVCSTTKLFWNVPGMCKDGLGTSRSLLDEALR